jgi:hypothetical protein
MTSPTLYGARPAHPLLRGDALQRSRGREPWGTRFRALCPSRRSPPATGSRADHHQLEELVAHTARPRAMMGCGD